MSDPKPEPRLAATVLLVRDRPSGLEVFMVERHHQIDFATGALVFPGGKVDPADADPRLRARCGESLASDDAARMLRVAAIRETFEECGVLLARARGGERLVDSPAAGEKFADLVERDDLLLATDCLVPFAHWITPAIVRKRFDTHFFLASSPIGHAGSHDGRESVDSIWITPNGAISDRKKWNVIFPTKLNLMKLANSSTVDEAIRAAQSTTVLPVTPWVENGPDGQMLRIRDDAGYALTSASMRDGL